MFKNVLQIKGSTPQKKSNARTELGDKQKTKLRKSNTNIDDKKRHSNISMPA